MIRRNLALALVLTAALLAGCRTVYVHGHEPPGRAYGHQKHKHVHGHRCGHWYYDGHWHDRPRAGQPGVRK